MIDQDDSRWFEWDKEQKKWSFAKTENYVFARAFLGTKRIGDMTREELLLVIATAYQERDELALALCDTQVGVEIDADDITHARIIVESYHETVLGDRLPE